MQLNISIIIAINIMVCKMDNENIQLSEDCKIVSEKDGLLTHEEFKNGEWDDIHFIYEPLTWDQIEKLSQEK